MIDHTDYLKYQAEALGLLNEFLTSVEFPKYRIAESTHLFTTFLWFPHLEEYQLEVKFGIPVQFGESAYEVDLLVTIHSDAVGHDDQHVEINIIFIPGSITLATDAEILGFVELLKLRNTSYKELWAYVKAINNLNHM